MSPTRYELPNASYFLRGDRTWAAAVRSGGFFGTTSATIDIGWGGTSGGLRLSIDGNGFGNIWPINITSSALNISDYRAKENLISITGALNSLLSLPAYRYTLKSDPNTSAYGFLAHEAAAVVPEAVFGEKDAVDENGDPVYQRIDYSKFVPLITAAIQELAQLVGVEPGYAG